MLALWLGWGWENSQAATFVSPDINDFNKATLDGQTAVGANFTPTNTEFVVAGNFFTITPDLLATDKFEFTFAFSLQATIDGAPFEYQSVTDISLFGLDATGSIFELANLDWEDVTCRDGSAFQTTVINGETRLIANEDLGVDRDGRTLYSGRVVIDRNVGSTRTEFDDILAYLTAQQNAGGMPNNQGQSAFLGFAIDGRELGGTTNSVAASTVFYANNGAQARLFGVDVPDASVPFYLTVRSNLTIPEPSSALLLALGGVALLKRRQRR